MRDVADQSLSALEARIRRWRADRDPSAVLDDQAGEEFERLLGLGPRLWPSGPPVHVMAVLAEFLWSRHLAGPTQDHGDLNASTGIFAMVYPRDPGIVPEQVRRHLATSVIACADPDRWGALVASALRGRSDSHRAPDPRPAFPDGGDRVSFLSQCGNQLAALFGDSGELDDLDDSVRLCQAAVDIAPSDHPHRAALLQNLAAGLKTRALHTGALEDLDGAIDAGGHALVVGPSGAQDRVTILTTHGTALMHRFERRGALQDLQRAVDAFEEALTLPEDGAVMAENRSLLSSALLRRAEEAGNAADLDRAADLGRRALDELPEGDVGRPAVQGNLGVVLRTRYERVGDPEDLDQALDLLRGALDHMGPSHPDRLTTMGNLSNALINRSVLRDSARNLDEGITLIRAATDLVPPDDPDRPRFLAQLGTARYRRFLRLRERSDIDAAITALQEAADTAISTHIDRRPILNALGTALQVRYSTTEDPDDLERAHRKLVECLHICPVGSPDHAGVMANVASTLHIRARHTGQSEDLTKAIEFLQAAVDIIDPDHPVRPSMLTKLSLALLDRFRAEGRPEDLDRAVEAGRTALRSPVSERPDRAYEASAAAYALTDRFVRNAAPADARDAVQLLREVARTPTADVYARLSAARSAGWLTATIAGRAGAAVHDYDVVELLPLLAWHGLGRPTRERLLTDWTGLVCDATAASIDVREPGRAVEQLEQGRAILWGQLLAARSDLTKLRAAHPGLAARLSDVRARLDQAAAAVSPPSRDLRTAPRYRPVEPVDAEEREVSAEESGARSAKSPPRPPQAQHTLQSLTRDVTVRVEVYRTWQDSRPVLDPEASDAADRIVELARDAAADPPEAIAALHAVAWLRWCRGRALPAEQGENESRAALRLFTTLWGVRFEDIAPTLVTAELRALGRENGTTSEPPEAAGPTARAILENALHAADPLGLARSAAHLKRLADLLTTDDPFRPLCLAHAGLVHQTRYERVRDRQDLDEAVRLGRLALAGKPSPVGKAVYQSRLGDALMVAFEATSNPADLDEAVGLLRETVTSMTSAEEAEEAEEAGGGEVAAEARVRRDARIIRLGRLASALTTRYLARDVRSDLDEAVTVCLELCGLLSAGGPELPGVRQALAAVAQEVNKESDDPVRFEQALLLSRALIAVTGIPTPSEMAAATGAGTGSGTERTPPGAAGDGTGTSSARPETEDPPSLAATHATAVTFGSTTVAAITVDDTDLDRFLATVRRICRTGGVVFVPELPSVLRHREGDAEAGLVDLECLVESVGECAALPLAVMEGAVTRPVPGLGPRFSPLLGTRVLPCLLAGPATLRSLVSHGAASLPDALMCRSRPLRTDFREWAHLWASQHGEEPFSSVAERIRQGDRQGRFAYDLAVLLATGHGNGALHGSARREHFVRSAEGEVVMLDHDVRVLCRPPTPAQCASDLVPLLPSFSPPEWRAFRFGYLHQYPGGRGVIDLIEYGDTTGWMRAMAMRDLASAASLLDTALEQCPPGDEIGRMVLLANRAYARSRTGRHAMACADADSAWKTSRTLAPGATPFLALHAALARLRAGDRKAATQTLLALVIGTGSPLVSDFAMRVVTSLFPGAGAQPSMSIPDDALPFIARKGEDLVPLMFFESAEGAED